MIAMPEAPAPLTSQQREILAAYMAEYPRPESAFFRVNRLKKNKFWRFARRFLGTMEMRSACHDGLVYAVRAYTKKEKNTVAFSTYAIKAMGWAILTAVDKKKKQSPHGFQHWRDDGEKIPLKPLHQFKLGEWLWNPDADTPADEAAFSDLIRQTEEIAVHVLLELGGRMATVLTFLYGIGKYREHETSELARKMNLSKTRIYQLENRAFAKVRESPRETKLGQLAERFERLGR